MGSEMCIRDRTTRVSIDAYRKVRSVVVKRIITCMLAREYRYDKISVLLVDIGVDVRYRHLVALAATRR